MMGLHIFVRDLHTETWVLQDPMRWADAYPGRIATAVAAFLDTGGGTLRLTGTPGAGCVCRTASWRRRASQSAVGECRRARRGVADAHPRRAGGATAVTRPPHTVTPGGGLRSPVRP